MTTAPYDLSITTITYNDDTSYRHVLRTLFKIESTPCPADKIDPITFDEQDIDDATLARVLDWIYSKTNRNPLFKTLYLKAAGFMLSEDAQTGLCILLAYDNLPLFHPMLCAFMNDKTQFSDKHPTYVALYNKLFS